MAFIHIHEIRNFLFLDWNIPRLQIKKIKKIMVSNRCFFVELSYFSISLKDNRVFRINFISRGHVTHWECFFRERHRLTSTKVKERNLLRNEIPTHCRSLQVWHCAFIECDFFLSFFSFFFYSIVSKRRKQLECDSEGKNVFIKKKYESNFLIYRPSFFNSKNFIWLYKYIYFIKILILNILI